MSGGWLWETLFEIGSVEETRKGTSIASKLYPGVYLLNGLSLLKSYSCFGSQVRVD